MSYTLSKTKINSPICGRKFSSQLSYTSYYKNPDVEFELVDTNIENRNLSLIDFQGLDYLENKTEEEKREIVLDWIKDFRSHNKHMFKFTYTCPICNETSTDPNFLVSLIKSSDDFENEFKRSFENYNSDQENEKSISSDSKDVPKCNHKCCINCWKDTCLHQFLNFNDNFHCYGCSKPIQFKLLTKYKILNDEQFKIYSLRCYNKKYNDAMCCSNCNKYFIYTRNSHRCPNCYFDFCVCCQKHYHKDLNLDCIEFEKFETTKEYINFVTNRENERLKIISEQEIKNKISPLFDELTIKVKLREKRLAEIERQKQLLKFNRESEKWIKEHTKKCPNCGIVIEKNKGCNHMTCYKCGYEFCWYCLEICTNPCEHFKICKAGAKWFDDGYRE